MELPRKVGTCECCNHDNVELTEQPYGSVHKRDETRWLCRPCDQTEASYYEDSSSVAGAELLPVLKTICWGINEILAAIREVNRYPPGPNPDIHA